jgi:hypothetical protein
MFDMEKMRAENDELATQVKNWQRVAGDTKAESIRATTKATEMAETIDTLRREINTPMETDRLLTAPELSAVKASFAYLFGLFQLILGENSSSIELMTGFTVGQPNQWIEKHDGELKAAIATDLDKRKPNKLILIPPEDFHIDVDPFEHGLSDDEEIEAVDADVEPTPSSALTGIIDALSISDPRPESYQHDYSKLEVVVFAARAVCGNDNEVSDAGQISFSFRSTDEIFEHATTYNIALRPGKEQITRDFVLQALNNNDDTDFGEENDRLIFQSGICEGYKIWRINRDASDASLPSNVPKDFVKFYRGQHLVSWFENITA